MKYTDPDGRKIAVTACDGTEYIWDDEKNKFYNAKTGKYGTTDTFVTEIKNSIMYLKNGSPYAANIIKKVSEAKNQARISFHDRSRWVLEGFFGKDIKIQFSKQGLEILDGTDSYGSPAMSLFHELCHAYSHLVEHKLRERFRDRSEIYLWWNGEEKNAVEMSNRAAAELGEPVRPDYVHAQAVLRSLKFNQFSNKQ